MDECGGRESGFPENLFVFQIVKSREKNIFVSNASTIWSAKVVESHFLLGLKSMQKMFSTRLATSPASMAGNVLMITVDAVLEFAHFSSFQFKMVSDFGILCLGISTCAPLLSL